MHYADMVAISAVLRAQLPVAFVNVARRTLEHFQPLRRLVDDQIDDFTSFPEIGFQRLHVGIEATE